MKEKEGRVHVCKMWEVEWKGLIKYEREGV
jgi:hypothetical protein